MSPQGDKREKVPAHDVKPTEFMSGLDFGDWVFRANLAIDRAHLVMLVEEEIVSREDAVAIFDALDHLQQEGFETLEETDDVHVATDAAIVARVGEDVGGRLHTARSRNDKFATWLRIAAREELLGLAGDVLDLREALLDRAEETSNWLLTGYTCLQHAQPTTLGHHLLAHERAFRRDFDRILDAYGRVNMNPLGGAALAGSGFDIDRNRTTELLGFAALVDNSMDAVGSRDVALEAAATTAIAHTNLSRLSEELVLWSSTEFDFVTLADEYTGGSSIMPQKVNPYAAELARGKAASVSGDLSSLLAIVKGLPMTYHHDFQDITRTLRRMFEETRGSVRTVAGAIQTACFDEDAMAESVEKGFPVATELADALVRETDVSFRTAHNVIKEVVTRTDDVTSGAIESVAEDLTGRRISIGDETVRLSLSPRHNVEMRNSPGEPGDVAGNFSMVRRNFRTDDERLEEARKQLRDADTMLEDSIERIRTAA